MIINPILYCRILVVFRDLESKLKGILNPRKLFLNLSTHFLLFCVTSAKLKDTLH